MSTENGVRRSLALVSVKLMKSDWITGQAVKTRKSRQNGRARIQAARPSRQAVGPALAARRCGACPSRPLGGDGRGVALGGGGIMVSSPVPMESACCCTVFRAAAGSAPDLVTFSISVSKEVTTCSHVGNYGGAWAVSSCLPKTASFVSAVRAGSCQALLTDGQVGRHAGTT